MTGATRSADLDFARPAGAEADSPPERRGLARDGVRLLVARRDASERLRLQHSVFRSLADHLEPGDLLVVNTSGTLPAAVDGTRADGQRCPIHVAAELDDGSWVVEIRRPDNSGPQTDAVPGETLVLIGGQRLRLAGPFPDRGAATSRLWRARPEPAQGRVRYLLDHGRPIRYGYLTKPVPLGDLQNVFAGSPGSAEMPSAARPLTQRVITDLVRRGITLALIVLHTGVSSPEKHEPPMPEPFEVPEATARLVESARGAGSRVVAVGTTSARALESAMDEHGRVVASSGWTDLVLGSRRPARVCTGLISGLHEPGASHLSLLEAVAGRDLVAAAYRAAVAERYLWHEFGDSMLFLP